MKLQGPSRLHSVAPMDLPPSLVRAAQFGIEREGLRVHATGDLARTDHPTEFGDKLSHPEITVDFSESQLELVTAPAPTPQAAHAALAALHARVRPVLAARGERLWPHSMPPYIPAEESIPIARFDDSEEGRRRSLYRLGLANRYGRRMQVISGIHVNLSFSPELLAALGRDRNEGASTRDRRDSAYFRTMRNFLRDRWLLVLLTGASPVPEPAAAPGHRPRTQSMRTPVHSGGPAPWATSLRVSSRGYANGDAVISPEAYASAAAYVHEMHRLLATRSARFAGLGPDSHGRPRQLNDRVLQQEKELYAPIRPKGDVRPGETHVDAIARRGVHYLEIRLIDLNPFCPEGLDLATLRLVHLFALDALLGSAAPLTPAEWHRAGVNHERVALAGRRPDLHLLSAHGAVSMAWLAEQAINRWEALADHLDRGLDGAPYRAAVAAARDQVRAPEHLLSARVAASLGAAARLPTTIHHPAAPRQIVHHAY